MPSSEGSKLAYFGGPPAFPDGPPPWPRQDIRIRDALLSAWEDGSWGKYLGRHCDQLSKELAELHDVEHVLLTASGTIAVELALRSVGVNKNDHVLMAAYDFPGNFRAIEAIGARPVLVDIAPGRFVPSAEIVEAAVREASPPVSAMVLSHLHGDLVDIPSITAFAKSRGIPVVEDACQAIGGRFESLPVGSVGDVGVLSFGGSKLLSAGRGGALMTRDETIAQRCRVFCDRGNNAFPLSELQAAVLLPQLAHLPSDTKLRAENAKKVVACCSNLDGIQSDPIKLDTWVPGFFKLGLRFDATQTRWSSRDEFLCAITAEGIAAGAGFRGFAKRSLRRCDRVGSLEEARLVAGQAVVLHHPILLEDDSSVQRCADTIRRVALMSG